MAVESDHSGRAGLGRSAFWEAAEATLTKEFPARLADVKTWGHELWEQARIAVWYARADAHLRAGLTTFLAGLPPARQAQWRRALAEPWRGHTAQSRAHAIHPFDGIEVSGYTMKCAYHVAMIETLFGCPLRDFARIVEIGGGIGELARFCRDLGFAGAYTILDQPAMGAIARWYLEGYDVQITETAEALPSTSRPLVIGTWSIDEIPLPARRALCHHWRPPAAWFVIYTPQIQGFENTTFFTQEFPQLTGCRIAYGTSVEGAYCWGPPRR